MTDSGNQRPGDAPAMQPKVWTPMAPPPAPASGGPGLLVRIVMGVVGLAVIGFGLMQMGQGMGWIAGTRGERLAYASFDPANPPALGDPGPAISAHLQKVGGAQPLNDGERQAIDAMVRETQASLPVQVDQITTLVGATSAGRNIVLDSRIMLPNAVPDLRAFRATVVDQMKPGLIAKVCEPGNVNVATFMRQHNVTFWHAYSFNDGNPPIFIEIPPQNCGRSQSFAAPTP